MIPGICVGHGTPPVQPGGHWPGCTDLSIPRGQHSDECTVSIQKAFVGTSLEVQGLRLCLPMQGVRV